MTIKDNIFHTLVVKGEQLTVNQLAHKLRTSEATVRSTVSRIRNSGYAIYANKKTDKRGKTKVVYRHGTPTKSMLKYGY